MTDNSARPARALNVLHIITGLDAGGAQSMLYKVLSKLDHAEYHSAVVSLTTRGRFADPLEALGIPVETLGMPSGRPQLAGFVRLVRLLRQRRPDVVQTWLFHSDLIGLIAARLAGVRCVAWNIRSAETTRSAQSLHLRITLRLLALLSRLPTIVVVNSEAGRRINEKNGYRPRAWRHIPNGIDLKQFFPSSAARSDVRRELGLPQTAVLIGLVARRDPRKDHNTFLRAASLFAKKRADVHFVLVGKGIDVSNGDLMAPVRENGLNGRVHLLGERTDIPRLTAALDVATCASYSEAFPNTLGEAMAAGVPCVATDVGDCRILIGDTGIVVPARDATALCDGWSQLLDKPAAELQELGVRARERIAAHFDSEDIARRYADLYDEIASK